MSLQRQVTKLLKLLQVPGALVHVKSKKETFELNYGYSDVKQRRHVARDDQYRIGSNTKMFIGIMLLQLYQEGKVDLDKPVSNYLLGIPNGHRITVRQIGEMR